MDCVWLRTNIRTGTDADENEIWVADEAYLRTGLTFAEVQQQFAALIQEEIPLTEQIKGLAEWRENMISALSKTTAGKLILAAMSSSTE